MNQSAFNKLVREEFDKVLAADQIIDVDEMVGVVVEQLQANPVVRNYLMITVLRQLVNRQVNQTIDAREKIGRRTVDSTVARSISSSTPVPLSSPHRTQLEERIVRIGSHVGPVPEMKKLLDVQGRTQNFWKWKEFVPTIRAEVELPNMTRDQLIAAADWRHNEAAAHVHNGEFLRQIANTLEPQQRVADVYDDATLTDLWKTVSAVEEFRTHTMTDLPAGEVPALEGETA